MPEKKTATIAIDDRGKSSITIERTDPRLQTYSGRWFSLSEPDPADVELIDIAHALSNLCRFAGHCRGFYSVAQHSVHVSQLVDSLMTGDARRWLRLAALLHDAHEAYTGDMIRDMKVVLRPGGKTRSDLDKVEDQVQAAVLDRFKVPLDVTMRDAIKLADLRALATEKRDLMRYGPGTWSTLDAIKPDERPIGALWSPREARDAFLDRLEEVRP